MSEPPILHAPCRGRYDHAEDQSYPMIGYRIHDCVLYLNDNNSFILLLSGFVDDVGDEAESRIKWLVAVGRQSPFFCFPSKALHSYLIEEIYHFKININIFSEQHACYNSPTCCWYVNSREPESGHADPTMQHFSPYDV